MLGIGNFANKLRKLRLLRDQNEQEEADAHHHRGVTLTTASVLKMMQRRRGRTTASHSDIQTSFEVDLSDKLSTTHESAVSKLNKSLMKKLVLALPHIGLLCFMCCYTALGAAIFSSVEFPNEIAHKTEQIDKLKRLQRSLIDQIAQVRRNSTVNRGNLDEVVNTWLDQMTSAIYEAKKTSQISAVQIYDNTTQPNYQWSFSSAVMFATTVVTTIGYGNIVPATPRGQGICLFYAALGVPLTLITIADLGKFVSAFILWLYRGCGRIKVKLTQLCQKRKMKGIGKMDGQLYNRQRRGYIEPTALESTKLSEETGEDEDDDDEDTVPPLFVMMVLLAYMSVGAALFATWENWDFGDSMYYCFVTVTTVGFGDLVPSDNSHFMLTLLYVFCGLVVTTMCIDLVGTHYIHKIHYVGRRMAAARELALLGGFRNIAALKRRYGLTDAEIEKLLGIKVKPTVMKPYVPENIRRLLYIDYDRTDDTTLASGFTTAPLDGDELSLYDVCGNCCLEDSIKSTVNVTPRVNRSISEHGELGWGQENVDFQSQKTILSSEGSECAPTAE